MKTTTMTAMLGLLLLAAATPTASAAPIPPDNPHIPPTNCNANNVAHLLCEGWWQLTSLRGYADEGIRVVFIVAGIGVDFVLSTTCNVAGVPPPPC